MSSFTFGYIELSHFISSCTLFSLSLTLCFMQHRGERRGLGGIFFDDLNAYDQEMLLSFATGKFIERDPYQSIIRVLNADFLFLLCMSKCS